MKKILISFLLATITFHSFAASLPRRVAADNHIKVVQYDPNNVVILKGRYGYQTQISFSENETVQNVSIGDSMAWLAVPVSNNLFVKPVAESSTNMTVITNLNSYNFQLDSSNSKVKPTYKLKFTYPEGGYDSKENRNTVASFNPDQMNWEYTFTGDKSIAPIQAFDDGKFTYFKFSDVSGRHLPAVFIVDKKRSESLVNYHMQGDYLVVNTVAKQFTLRDGAYVASVYNEKL